MKDVAALAGVGTMTVSRVLRTPDAVSQRTRQRVEAAIRATGFVANSAAASLRSGSMPMVAVIVPTLRTSIVVDTLDGLQSVLSAANHQMLVGCSNYDLPTEEQLVRDALRWRPAGIVLCGLTHTNETLNMIRTRGIPLAEVWSITDAPRDIVVGISNIDASFEMAQSLVKWGYRRICYAHISRHDNERAQQRFDGYRLALQASGIIVEPDMHRVTENTYQAGARIVTEFRSRYKDLDAVFFGSDVLAVGALMECHRRGWKVPEEIAIAGYDNLDIAAATAPPLTTVSTQLFEVGKRGAELLLDRIYGKLDRPVAIGLQGLILRRGSA